MTVQFRAPPVISMLNLLGRRVLCGAAPQFPVVASCLNNQPNFIQRPTVSNSYLSSSCTKQVSQPIDVVSFSLPPGAWETKVSNREKKQQRRKDKGPEDSGGPGGVEAPKTHVEAPVASVTTNTKKNRGNNGIFN